MFFIALYELVAHGEIVVGIDGAFLGHQIADMAVRGQNFKVLSQVLLDCLRLRWRFHNDEINAHFFSVRQYRPPGRVSTSPRSSRINSMEATAAGSRPLRSARVPRSWGSKPSASNRIS